MPSWRERLAKLVAASPAGEYPLLVFDAARPSGKEWPSHLPSCQGLKDFYGVCNGGVLSVQYNWLPLERVSAETDRWRNLLEDYFGDGQPVLLEGRHVVLADDSSGAPLVWDASHDRMATFFPKGGDWEPFRLSFEDFMTALFFEPFRVYAGSNDDDLWIQALQQLESS